MKKSVKKQSGLSKKELLKKEQVILAEERTLLAYMRTVLSFIGIVFVVAKIYFEEISIFNPALLIIVLISGVVLIDEFRKVERLKRQHGGY